MKSKTRHNSPTPFYPPVRHLFRKKACIHQIELNFLCFHYLILSSILVFLVDFSVDLGDNEPSLSNNTQCLNNLLPAIFKNKTRWFGRKVIKLEIKKLQIAKNYNIDNGNYFSSLFQRYSTGNARLINDHCICT